MTAIILLGFVIYNQQTNWIKRWLETFLFFKIQEKPIHQEIEELPWAPLIKTTPNNGTTAALSETKVSQQKCKWENETGN